MTKVVVVINSMTIFEVIFKWNILLELFHIGLTCDVDERSRIHLLTWILCQDRVVRNYFHYIIRLF